MSKYASKTINSITPYVPGEQPQDRTYIKLNTNENAYYTSQKAVSSITEDVLKNLKRYSDPTCKCLVSAIAKYYNVNTSNVLTTNGSDEALAFCFLAYGTCGVAFADVTYGFYDVFAKLYNCPVEHIALKDDYTIDINDYLNIGKTIVIANPNAQTGIALPFEKLEKVISSNVNNIVIVDQAYVDFGGQNVIPLINKYDNLVVVNTFSKSRALAGARVGFIVANERLIDDLNKVKYSFHPYNVNSLSLLLATNAINDVDYFNESVGKIIRTRERLTAQLKELSFEVLPSSANFILAKKQGIGGKDLYLKLKERGILVRHFDEPRIKDFIRITIGTDEEIDILIDNIKEIVEEL
jgi:histidinol-phosphate aminotransferase